MLKPDVYTVEFPLKALLRSCALHVPHNSSVLLHMHFLLFLIVPLHVDILPVPPKTVRKKPPHYNANQRYRFLLFLPLHYLLISSPYIVSVHSTVQSDSQEKVIPFVFLSVFRNKCYNLLISVLDFQTLPLIPDNPNSTDISFPEYGSSVLDNPGSNCPSLRFWQIV